MTRLPTGRELALVLACLLAALGLVGTFLWQDRGSLERGNRLYRNGQVQRAEPLYRPSAESPATAPTALYNLGTALLTLGTPEAEQYLLLATEAGDSAAAQRGHYNLGQRFLTQLDVVAAPDSWIPLLAAAIGSNRAALRLDPGDENAQWNLALAQRMLDDLTRGLEPAEVRSDEDETAPSEDGIVIPQPAEGERQPMTEGEREALAGDDPGPLTESEALGLVEAINDDPEQLLWGILWSRRPDVAWWAESYPGGELVDTRLPRI